MKRKLTSLFLALSIVAGFSLQARESGLEDWQDPTVFERNRMPMRATFTTDQQQTISLNGQWKFNWNGTIEGRLKGFEAVSFNDSAWDSMPVPGMWELNGYGDPLYVNTGYPWRGHYENNPPYPATEHNYVGQYRKTFTVGKEWIGKQICLCIGSATSNVRVWVNGKEVGYSQDSKLEARFDITRFVKEGENLVALEIFRWCDGTYLEDQDFYRLSGIARGVYVYTRETRRIEDVHVVAGMDGNVSIMSEVTPGITSVSYEILDREGKSVCTVSGNVDRKAPKSETGNLVVNTSARVSAPELWSAETPVLYTLKVSASDKKGTVESTAIPFGFRTVEIKDAQLLVNGKPVLIKGADRHEMNPYKGYVVSEADMIQDIRIMKELNINAVRTCHYPDDPMWVALCDRYGLYVVDEGNIESHGMGYKDGVTLAQDPRYHDAHMARDRRLVQRDFNHPSVIVWSLGNEAGNGQNFLDCYDMVKAMDPSRPVQYERALHYGSFDTDRNTDIYCPMYMSPDDCVKFLQDAPMPLIQCEYAHAMGNSMGNFKEYWDLVRKYPRFQGGFIWDFVDQAIYKKVDASVYGTGHILAFGGDWNDYDPSDGSFNCNGVIAADRSLHPHAYEVRYQYRNILTREADAIGKVTVYNENFFLPLDNYALVWDVELEGEKILTGTVGDLGGIAPQQEKVIDLGFTEDDLKTCGGHMCKMRDCYLNVHFTLKRPDGLLPAGFEVAYDQIAIYESPSRMVRGGVFKSGSEVLPKVDGTTFSGTFVFAGTSATSLSASWSAAFDKESGALVSYKVNGRERLSAPLMPNFNRAVTENDMGASLQHKQAMWRKPSLKVKSFDINKLEDCYQVAVEYSPIEGAATVAMSYKVYPDGTILGCEAMKDAGKLSEAPDMFRFGMRFAMPGEFSTVDFYGKGPWENYCDRNSGAVTGHYVQSVNDQYHYGYVRTQESGTKTGLKRFSLLDNNGDGLEITSDIRFSASALPFSIEDLDCAMLENDAKERNRNHQAGAPQHSPELKAKAHENDRENGTTYVCFDLMQEGVGGINSWGTVPLEQYRLHAAEREFHFTLRPVLN